MTPLKMDFRITTLTGMAIAMAMVMAGLAVLSAQAVAVEFTRPPGQNLEAEETRLKEKITKVVTDIIGGELVDVVTSVRYAKSEKLAAAGDQRAKLPGFNKFITQGEGDEEVLVSEFIRLRQVMVLISDQSTSDPETLKNAVESQGDLNSKKGDLVKVVKVPADGEPRGDKPREPRKKRFRAKKPVDPEREVASTAYLVRARKAFFEGENSRALDYVLKAINIEPNNAQAYVMLGSIYYTMKWHALALKYWEYSLAFDPGNREIEDLASQLKDKVY